MEGRTHVDEVDVVDVAVLGDEVIVDGRESRCMLILGGESERGDDGEQIDGLLVDGESLEKDGGHPDSGRGEMEQRRDLREREGKCRMMEERKWRCYLMECESKMVRKRCEEKLVVLMLIFFGEEGEKGSGMVRCGCDMLDVSEKSGSYVHGRYDG